MTSWPKEHDSTTKSIAWLLPTVAIPPESQGGDIDAGLFWSEDHLCGKGDTPEAALHALEQRITDLQLDDPSPSETSS